ncbi:unnamed protein product [Microthlaspi erraticum]|uniref:DUF4378 domain-containing protein n=1 Tax=Microthlaspi erraticum TaxID=1685480 RepID=A0A6D2HQX6_9BRAS|nr:unnamed protein product [Microthlaspi erraticum]
MEREICRRHLSREGTGCVWVFMNMFDFRHGGSNQKLLMDKKRGSKRIIGIEANKVEKQLTCDCEESEGGIQSVKKLIEEEIDDKSRQKCDFECRGKTKAKTSKRRSRTSEDLNILSAGGDDDHAEKTVDQCPRTSHDSNNDDDDSEEKFSELIKRLIAQKDSETFQVLDSKEESFLTSDEPISQRIKETSSSNEKCTIVILKPEPNSLNVGSSHGYKAKNRRFGSRFILSRLRRRLIGKKPCNTQQDPDPDPDALSSHKNQNCCLGQEMETNSGRHVSEGNKEEETIHDGSEDSKKSVCGIYVTAKKHLSEMLAEGDMCVEVPDKEVPRILGKILALPEFSTPVTSPRLTFPQDSVGDKQITEESNTQQCSTEDYPVSETLGIDSNKHEETEFTSDMPVPEDNGKEEKIFLDSLSEAISFSIIQQDACVVDEDKFEVGDKDEQKQQPLEKATFDERNSPCSPPNSSVRMSECQENATDFPGKSSPVSVLEPLFTDDDMSPDSCTRFSSAEMRMQPLCIRFDEPESPRLNEDNDDVKTRMDDKELALAYIEAVVKSSDLNWEELLSRSFYSEKILEQALMDDIDFCSTKFCTDKKLLFDCINEVLMELCDHGPWISFAKPELRFCPDMENAAEVVQEEVYWHLLPLPSPHTLDQIVHKDFARSGIWMDLRFDIGCIGSETGEMILDELLEEMISNCTDLFQAETVDKTTMHKLIP